MRYKVRDLCHKHGCKMVRKRLLGIQISKWNVSNNVKVCWNCVQEAKFAVRYWVNRAKEARNERARRRAVH